MCRTHFAGTWASRTGTNRLCLVYPTNKAGFTISKWHTYNQTRNKFGQTYIQTYIQCSSWAGVAIARHCHASPSSTKIDNLITQTPEITSGNYVYSSTRVPWYSSTRVHVISRRNFWCLGYKVVNFRGRGGGMAMPSNRHPGPRRTLYVCLYVCLSKFITSLVIRVPFANCETRFVCWVNQT